MYTDLFCQKQDCTADGWIGNIKGGINCFSDAFLSFEDIRADLELDAPKGLIFDWYWDNVYNQGKSINYYSYIKGLRIKDVKEPTFEDKKCYVIMCSAGIYDDYRAWVDSVFINYADAEMKRQQITAKNKMIRDTPAPYDLVKGASELLTVEQEESNHKWQVESTDAWEFNSANILEFPLL